MNIADILKQYADRPTDTETDFDEVARQVSPDVLGSGITQAFRSDQTPPFQDMLGSLFGGSNSQQRAGLLNQLIRTLGPTLLSGMAGGALGRLLQGARGSAAPEVTASDADQVTAEQMQQIGAAAEKQDPTILDKVGAYYAQHPEVVKVLGGAALAIALGQMATRNKR